MLLYQFLFSQILNITPSKMQRCSSDISILNLSFIPKSKKLKQTKFTLQFHQTITITHINRKSIFAKHLARIIACHVALLSTWTRERERGWFSLAIRLSPWIARGWLLEDSTGSGAQLLRKVESRNNKGIEK